MYIGVETKFINEAVCMQRNISYLYKTFASMFNGDRKFWIQMSNEKAVHATMIQMLKDNFVKANLHCVNTPNIKKLNEINIRIVSYTAQVEYDKISRKEAFQVALEFEHQVYNVQFRDAFQNIRANGIRDIFTCIIENDKRRKVMLMRYLKNIMYS